MNRIYIPDDDRPDYTRDTIRELNKRYWPEFAKGAERAAEFDAAMRVSALRQSAGVKAEAATIRMWLPKSYVTRGG